MPVSQHSQLLTVIALGNTSAMLEEFAQLKEQFVYGVTCMVHSPCRPDQHTLCILVEVFSKVGDAQSVRKYPVHQYAVTFTDSCSTTSSFSPIIYILTP